jgi:hypothetical protein
MEARNDIFNELKALSPTIAAIVKTNVFSVPEGYFNTLSETIFLGVKDDTILSFNSISKSSFFEVPKGYFENLSTNILNKIKEQPLINAVDEIRVLSSTLYSLHGKNVFELPAGYFNKLADNILSNAKPQQAKIIAMPKRNVILKYAAAAVITGCMSLGVYKFINNKPVHNEPVAIAALDPTIEKGIKMNDKQFDETLNNLSEDDIANYLDKNGSEADVAELSSNIDDNTLPNQDDYLLDNKTLDNYLSSDNINQKSN